MIFSEWWQENQQRAIESLKTDPYRILEDCWNFSTVFGAGSLDTILAGREAKAKNERLIRALREIVATITDGNICRYIARQALQDLNLPLTNDELNIGNCFVDHD